MCRRHQPSAIHCTVIAFHTYSHIKLRNESDRSYIVISLLFSFSAIALNATWAGIAPALFVSMATNLSVFCSPERYVQGKDATKQLGSQMKAIGLEGPALLVAPATVRPFLEDSWKASLGASGIDHSVHDFKGECTEEEIATVVEEASRRKCKVIVGAGGGKAIDTAKAAANHLNIPVVSCPTVASTDAPCSALSVIYNTDGSFNKYMFMPRHPVLVLVDTAVIARAPKRALVGGLGDALATWYEARTVKEACKANFLQGKPTLTGTALAKICCDILLEDGPAAAHAVDCQVCTPALERVVEANTLLSGLGFENGGLAVAHALHNGLTAVPETHKYTHGEKVAFGLGTQLVLEGRPQEEIDTVMTFCHKVGLPITLTEVGVDVDDKAAIRAIADRTIAPGESSHNEPFEMTSEIVSDAMVATHWAGVRFQDKNQ